MKNTIILICILFIGCITDSIKQEVYVIGNNSYTVTTDIWVNRTRSYLYNSNVLAKDLDSVCEKQRKDADSVYNVLKKYNK